jgi:hypothetical protein
MAGQTVHTASGLSSSRCTSGSFVTSLGYWYLNVQGQTSHTLCCFTQRLEKGDGIRVHVMHKIPLSQDEIEQATATGPSYSYFSGDVGLVMADMIADWPLLRFLHGVFGSGLLKKPFNGSFMVLSRK